MLLLSKSSSLHLDGYEHVTFQYKVEVKSYISLYLSAEDLRSINKQFWNLAVYFNQPGKRI